MTETRTVLFLCPHAAAKSVLAAAEFERLASARGLIARADAAGTEPDPATNPAVVAALAADGIDVSAHRPRRVTADELTGAWRVVSLGCDVDGIAPVDLAVERWDDVPPVSADLPTARAAIRALVGRLVDELVGYMHRDLVERRRWVDEQTYRLALALAQIMPGPLGHLLLGTMRSGWNLEAVGIPSRWV